MLANLINQHSLVEAQAGKWDDVAAILNAPTIVVRDPTPVTYAMLTRDLGDKARHLVAGTLRAIAKSEAPEAGEIEDAHSVLLNERGGLALDTDDRQGMVDKVAALGSWPDALRDAIKAKGLRLASIAGSPVTAEQCQSAYESHQLAQQWATLQNESINPAAGSRVDLIAALKAAIETLEAG